MACSNVVWASYLYIFHQQLLDHMNESAVYNEVDLKPFQQRVDELRQIVQDDSKNGKHPKAMTQLCERQIKECGEYCSNNLYSRLTDYGFPRRSSQVDEGLSVRDLSRAHPNTRETSPTTTAAGRTCR